MPIPTTRTNEAARILINTEICQGCGKCVEVCKDFGIVVKDGKAQPSGTPVFGCIACGHCMAICPTGAVRIRGRTLAEKDLFPLPDKGDSTEYAPLFNLLRKRRSIREFTSAPIEQHLVEQILDAARTAPMGLPPSDVNVLVLSTRESVRRFSKDFCSYLEGIKLFFSDWFLALSRPFFGKDTTVLLKCFARPLVKKYTESMAEGVDLVTYDAPLALYFYGSPYCDPADPIVAATYAMLAAESLGLGTCMLGAIHPMIQNGGSAATFRERHGIKYKSREGLFVIIGHPAVHYTRGIQRTFASVTTV